MTKGLKFFFLAFFISLPFWLGLNIFQENLEKFFYAQISQPFENISEVKIPPKPKKPNLDLEARSAISVKVNQAGREKILFEKNGEDILPIASLTKLMTAVIIFENENYDLENSWTISPMAANQENAPYGYGYLDSEVGKKFKVGTLLDLALIYSSNDAAFALAEVIGVENFVEKMNQKAEELGLKNTNFVNPTGLDPENLHYSQETFNYFNYSTAKDLAKLAQYILEKHPSIFEITLKEGPYPIENGVSTISLPENQTILGGKTGYTDEAGGCLLLIFQNEKESLFYNVILGTPKEARIEEMQKLIDWFNLQ